MADPGSEGGGERESPPARDGERGSPRIGENPFYVLQLPTDCSAMEVERQGSKLLSMLDLGLESAKTYPTPLGPRSRTTDTVRRAMAELRDPDRRLVHEVWAAAAPEPACGNEADDEGPAAPAVAPGFAAARRVLGWGRP